jgi:hypothetical protein
VLLTGPVPPLFLRAFSIVRQPGLIMCNRLRGRADRIGAAISSVIRANRMEVERRAGSVRWFNARIRPPRAQLYRTFNSS